ncbi:MAG: response regulator transcription factor [Firmicutes bacterium]|nr:response regulator transcription factor [Bacillota bacterium]
MQQDAGPTCEVSVLNEKILIVDDEESIAELVEFTLKKEGFRTAVAYEGVSALEKASLEKPDLILLDLMLPGINGLDLCRKIRADAAMSMPIIMLTAKTDVVDKVLGLEFGADDYITKPFSPRELTARVKAVLRRSAGQRDWNEKIAGFVSSELCVDDIRIDLQRHQVWAHGQKVDLTRREYELLKMLMANQGIVLSRELLLEKVWGYDYAGDTRTVDVHVARLRQHLGDDPANPRYILTVRGVGYRMKESS